MYGYFSFKLVCVPHTFNALRGQKRAADPLGRLRGLCAGNLYYSLRLSLSPAATATWFFLFFCFLRNKNHSLSHAVLLRLASTDYPISRVYTFSLLLLSTFHFSFLSFLPHFSVIQKWGSMFNFSNIFLPFYWWFYSWKSQQKCSPAFPQRLTCICLTHRGQRGVSDAQELALKKVVICHCRCWKLNPGLLEKQPLQPIKYLLSLSCHITYTLSILQMFGVLLFSNTSVFGVNTLSWYRSQNHTDMFIRVSYY